jgi:transposase-like protein
MKPVRKRSSGEFKARVALEVVKGQRTLNEMASEHQLHPNLLLPWNKHLLDSLRAVLADKGCTDPKAQEAQLYQPSGRGTRWVQRLGGWRVAARRLRVQHDHAPLSLVRQGQ